MIAWEVIDTFTRSDVLERARAEVTEAMDSTLETPLGLQFGKLLSKPLLQSIFAEETRIRNAIMVQRVPMVDNFTLGSFKFPKGKMIVASCWHDQRDRSIWNEGPVNGVFHPVDDFWADRFLIYPNDPMSGPRKPSTSRKVKSASTAHKAEKNEPQFTTEPVTGSYFPFGGGKLVISHVHYSIKHSI